MDELHPGRLTWNLRTDPWKRKIIFQTIIFRFHVNLPGCKGKLLVWLGDLDHGVSFWNPLYTFKLTNVPPENESLQDEISPFSWGHYVNCLGVILINPSRSKNGKSVVWGLVVWDSNRVPLSHTVIPFISR